MEWQYLISFGMVAIATGIAWAAGFYLGRLRGFIAGAQPCFDAGASLRRACEDQDGDMSQSTCSITMYGCEFKFKTKSATGDSVTSEEEMLPKTKIVVHDVQLGGRMIGAIEEELGLPGYVIVRLEDGRRWHGPKKCVTRLE